MFNKCSDGIITESNSTWAAPVVLVSKKKTKEMRFAIDYRGLNARTQVINFPIPDLQDALDSVGTAQSKIFSVMDLKSLANSPASRNGRSVCIHNT